MPRKQTITYAQLKVGIVVSIALLIFMFTTLYITREGGLPLFGGQYTVYSYLGDVAGLKTGAPVHLSGVEVGSVTAVEFAEPGAPGRVRVTMKIRSDVQPRITSNSMVRIGSLGVLGEKMVEIDPGPPGGEVIADGGIVPGESEGDPIRGIVDDASAALKQMRDLVAGLQQGEGTLGRLFKDEELHRRLVDVTGKARDVLARLDSSEGTLGKLFNDPSVYDNLNQLSTGLKELVARIEEGKGGLGRLVMDEELAVSVASAIRNLDTVTTRMAEGDGTVSALLNERELYDQLRSLTANLESIAARLERGEGTAGRLLHDRQLYDNLNQTVGELQALIQDIRRDPKKYLRVKVSLF